MRFNVVVEEIKNILENNGYDVNLDTILRINTMIESIRDDNQINTLDYVIKWFNKKREESDMTVQEIGINDLDKWDVSSMTGNISHESKGFFEIIKCNNINFQDLQALMNVPITQQFELYADFELVVLSQILPGFVVALYMDCKQS
jgi:hypothetical protein